ncbi:MAG: hypothetical protein GY760_25785 [Deltaproteobacteria bacterium]|nr:hypothetical protein [Deltaproteobacteria bacterium]
MKTFYIAETQHVNDFTKATKIEAKNLRGAKLAARKRRVFLGTCLSIGISTDENGFINDLISYTDINGEWLDCNSF